MHSIMTNIKINRRTASLEKSENQCLNTLQTEPNALHHRNSYGHSTPPPPVHIQIEGILTHKGLPSFFLFTLVLASVSTLPLALRPVPLNSTGLGNTVG